jgi:pimeloyl-ACP methyl ester carboxylesterase
MRLWSALISGLFIFSSCTSSEKNRGPQNLDLFSTSMVYYEPASLHLRLGQYLEAPGREFKGCVLYLQGLGDSIQNHAPLFSKLSDNGFRVVTFDYMGQGGSEGYMNNTRVHDVIVPQWTISNQAQFVWNHYSANSDETYGRSCAQKKRFVIGWSTGGLAAYKMAVDEWAHAVVLLAPGISPKVFVGASAQNKIGILSQDVITMQTLTRVNYTEGVYNPHVDEINPTSPTHVPMFATNLLVTSKITSTSCNSVTRALGTCWEIKPQIKGLVLLSGIEDTYVDQISAKEILRGHAPHFEVKDYPGALHELDNETPDVATDVQNRAVSFFLSQ